MPQRLLEVLREFSCAILDPYDPDDLLQQLIDRTVDLLDADGAGIMLVDLDGKLGFAAASGPRVARMEEVQTASGTGVCYHAFTTNQVVAARSVTDLQRWPDYTQRAQELCFGSVLGVPLNTHGQTIGVLNIYRDREGDWTDEELEVAEILATVGAGYILSSAQLRAQHDLAEHLQTALDSRGVIERAKGILMAKEGVTAETAFAALRKASMDSNRKLRDVAQELVDRNESG
jgi:GAF domain-containing protein